MSDFFLMSKFIDFLIELTTFERRDTFNEQIRNIVILVGDINAKVGGFNFNYENVMGKHGL